MRLLTFAAACAACMVLAGPAAADSTNTINFTSPADGAVLKDAPTVHWSVAGDLMEGSECKLAKAGSGTIFQNVCVMLPGMIVAPQSDLQWDMLDWVEGVTGGDGSYTVTYTPVWANAGGQASASLTFKIDTTPPTVLLSGAAGWTGDNTPAVSMTVYDANPGTSYCALDPADSSDKADYTVCPSDSFSLPTVSDGAHQFWVLHEDLAGNVTTASRSFDIDATPPVISVDGLQPGATMTSAYPSVSVSASDAGSGMSLLSCAWDGVSPGSCSSSAFTMALLSDGPHTLDVTATDQLGNLSTIAMPFTVDTTGGLKQGLVAPKSGRYKLKRGRLAGSRYSATVTTTFAIPPGGDAKACSGTAATRVLLKKKQLGSARAKWKAAGSNCTATSTLKLSKKFKGKKLTLILDYKNGPIKAFRISGAAKL